MSTVSNLVSTVLSSLVFALIPMASQAIGLGNVMLHSYLNEPLEADIALTDLKGIDPGDVIATVASQQAYEEAGLQPIGWLTSIRFQVIKSDIEGRPVLKLKTKEVVKDPFVDLLIEVKWPGGQLFREYTLLLDPPQAIAGASYRSRDGESLWGIAKSLSRNTQSNIYQTVTAIAKKNPHAFHNGNIERMRSGVMLTLPDKAELESYSVKQKAVVNVKSVEKPVENVKPVALESPPKPLTLVAPVQTHIEEAIDTLKRTNEDIVKKNQSLEKLLLMKEDEIKKLDALLKQSSAVDQFAVAVSDPPKKQVELDLAEPNLAQMTQAKPYTNAIKVNNTLPNQSPHKAITADAEQSAHSDEPVKPTANALLWFLVLSLSAMMVVIVWLRRNTLSAFLARHFVKRIAPAAVHKEQEIANYGLQFDLDKTLDAIAAQEKRFKKPTSTSEPQEVNNEKEIPTENVSNEHIDLQKKYTLALEEALPSMQVEELPDTDNKYNIQKAQIALAKAYVDMGEFTDAREMLIELKKSAVGENLKQIELLLQSITNDNQT